MIHKNICTEICIDLFESYPTQYQSLKYEESAALGIGYLHLNITPRNSIPCFKMLSAVAAQLQTRLYCIFNTGKHSRSFTISRN